MHPDEMDAQIMEVICLGPGTGKWKDLLLVPPLHSPVYGIPFSSFLNAHRKWCSF